MAQERPQGHMARGRKPTPQPTNSLLCVRVLPTLLCSGFHQPISQTGKPRHRALRRPAWGYTASHSPSTAQPQHHGLPTAARGACHQHPPPRPLHVPGLMATTHSPAHCWACRDRLALCQLWRAIILRDEAAMKAHAAELGVQGEAGGWVCSPEGAQPGSGPPRLPPVLRGAHAAARAPGAAVALAPAEP